MEYRIFGPPGCGKTTALARQIARAVETHGPESVLVASFTRAAAAEIAGRNLPISKDQVGTLHAHAYRALGFPKIAEGHLDDWNQSHPGRALSGGRRGDLDEAAADVYASVTDADRLHLLYESHRARMTPRELWSQEVLGWAQTWEDWKRECGYFDFTDLIERAIQEEAWAPGAPSIGFLDEVQDFTKLELTLVRHWAEQMETVVLAGDDDQCLYSFKGASPSSFLDPPIPAEQKRVLRQSYRVPRAVEHIASAWISQVTRREPKEYRARDADGFVTKLHGSSWANLTPILNDAERHLSDGKTVMFLAACGYMLGDLTRALKGAGWPFWNPYRRSRGDWNPLHPGRGISTRERVLAFLRPDNGAWGEQARMWSAEDVRHWMALVKTTGLLQKGGSKLLDDLATPDPRGVSVESLLPIFTDDALTRALDGDTAWLRAHAQASKAGKLDEILAVVKARGAKALKDNPQITVGTIHSVKGGEAEIVYLFPDLSAQGYEEWLRQGESKDSVIRQFYVGMTRAKEGLVLCDCQSFRAVPLMGVT